MDNKAINIQNEYYKNTAYKYDKIHIVGPDDPHYFALTFLSSAIKNFRFTSILDVGSGTGRALRYFKKYNPTIAAKGIEPVSELRQIGYQKGLTQKELFFGDAYNLDFDNNSFDLVCAFGMLHHLQYPNKAIKEMIRIAKKGIFISDGNNFAQGNFIKRILKQLLYTCHLWNLSKFIQTKGKKYFISKNDGLAYSYSIFNNYNLIARHCKSIHLFNTRGSGANFFKSVPHLALLGIKK